MCNEHFFTSAQRVAHIQKQHADKGEDITDTYSRKDTIMRKTASVSGAAAEEEGEAPKKAPVPILPKVLPSSQDIRYYKVPASAQLEGMKVQKAYSLVSGTKVLHPPQSQQPPQMPKFVVLPAKKPYGIVTKPMGSLPGSESSPSKTYSRKDQPENVSIHCCNLHLACVENQVSFFQSRTSLPNIITVKKPRTDGPIKIVINKSSGVAHVISNSCVSSEVYWS